MDISDNSHLVNGHCVPCEGGVDPMGDDEIEKYKSLLMTDWVVSADSKAMARDFKFKNFKESMEFVVKVGEIAEEQGHHPDIVINYNSVNISLSTHAIGGLSTNDFILASKIEVL